VGLAPYAAGVFAELGTRLFRDLSLDDIGVRAALPARQAFEAPAPAIPQTLATPAPAGDHFVGELRLHRYRALFSGPAVERVPELRFQRPVREIELSGADAGRRGIASGDTVLVRSNGTSVELRARVNRKLIEGVARITDEHAGDLHAAVEVVRA
jgi:anaerobic selenocysteine-containing dehydrogenase